MKFNLSDIYKWPSKTDEVDSAEYLIYGFVMFALKYNLDRILSIAILKTNNYSAIGFFVHLDELFAVSVPPEYALFRAAFLLTSIPFLYCAIVLTVKRIRSIGLSPFWLLPFFIPFINLALFLLIGLLPAKTKNTRIVHQSFLVAALDTIIPRGMLANATAGIFITGIVALLITLVSVSVFKTYGFILFLLVPFLLGILPVLLFSFREQRTFLQCFFVSLISTTVIGLLLIVFALEGVFCVLMAAPLAYLCSFIGATLAYFIQNYFWKNNGKSPTNSLMSLLIVLFATPFLMGAEADLNIPPNVYAVKTAVVINAKPEKIWEAVVAFTKIPPPKETMFQAGIAYPIQAKIYGHGVGAVRHCIFSTGPFVEPITVWDAPRRLKFNVASQPPIMREFSPYPNLQPPHVDNYLRSQGGQFLLTPLSKGQTKLEGTTWYTHKIWPQAYWHLWSDAIMHKIHLRVLTHIKNEVENTPENI